MSTYYYIFDGQVSSGIELNDDTRLEIYSGGTASETIINSGCQATVYSGGTASRTTINSKGWMEIDNGGSADYTKVTSGASLFISSGGTATNVDWTPFSGRIAISYGAYVTFSGKLSGTYYGSDNELFSHADVIKSKILQGHYNDIFVMSGGTASDTQVGYGAAVKVFEGGCASATTLNQGKAYIYSGGSADGLTVNFGGSFELHSGGSLTNLTISYDHFDISVAPDTYLQGTRGGKRFEMKDGLLSGFVYSDGRLHVASGGIVEAAVIGGGESETDYACLLVSSGGIASNTVMEKESYVTVSGGGVAYGTVVSSGGELTVADNGLAVDNLVQSGGIFYLRGGGTAEKTTVKNTGRLYVSSGGRLTGRMTFEDGAAVSADDGAVIDFDLIDKLPEDGPILSGWSTIQGSPDYTITVNDLQTDGTYTLASGAAGFDSTITVMSLDGEELATLTVGDDPEKIWRKRYSLNVTDSLLTLTVESIVAENTPDDGWNDYVYDKKRLKKKPPEPVWNPQLDKLNTTVLNPGVTEILLDREDSIDMYGMRNFVGKLDGVEDASDFARIELEHAASLSFDLESIEGGKFVIYKLTQSANKKTGLITVTMKSLQSTALKMAKDAIVYTARTKSLLLEAGEYYISMQGAIAKKGDTEGFYNVLLDSSTRFYSDGDSGWNNWLYDKKTKTPNPDRYDFSVTYINLSTSDVAADTGVSYTDEESGVTYGNFAGFGDDTDFARIRMDYATSLGFTVTATDAAKFTIWRLDEKEGKNGVTYTQKSIQATTLKKDKETGLYTADTKSILLEKGAEYFISVQSTNAKKGGSAYYNIEINQDATTFYVDTDSGWNNYLYDKNQKSQLNYTLYTHSAPLVINSGTTVFKVDSGVSHEESGVEWSSFVGFGDAADFKKIEVQSDAKLSFTLQATDAAKFTVWRLDVREENGYTFCTQKALQSTTLKKAKGADIYTAATKALSLKAGTYYISVESTNAKKGGRAYYNIEVNQDACTFAVSAPASALSMPDTAFAGQPGDTLAADASSGSAQEKILDESGAGILASL